MSDNPETLLTLTAAAARIAMSTETVRRYVRTGKLKAYLFGGRYRIEPSDLEKLLTNVSTRTAPTRAQASA